MISPLLVLARAWRPGGIFRGWRIAAIIVLGITGVAWLFFREYAGYVGGGAWFALLFLPAVGLRKASQLAAQGRYELARRLTALLQFLHPTTQLRDQLQLFRNLEFRKGARGEIENTPQDRHGRLRDAPVVVIFILLNVAAFCIELWRGFAVVNNGEFWRLFTALFLHYNLLHLIFNLFALYVLGPPLERTIGALRFAMCYLIAGIGSTGGVVLLTLLKVVRPAELVGASGCVMGIVGAWAGFLLRHRDVRQAKQRLLNILLIIVIQIVFDIFTPQVSTSAHLCGLITGFVIGLTIAPKRTSLSQSV